MPRFSYSSSPGRYRRRSTSVNRFRGGFVDRNTANSVWLGYKAARKFYRKNKSAIDGAAKLISPHVPNLARKAGESIIALPGSVYTVKRRVPNATITNTGTSLSRSRYSYGKPSQNAYTVDFKKRAQKNIISNAFTHRMVCAEGEQVVHSRPFACTTFNMLSQGGATNLEGDWRRISNQAAWQGSGTENSNTNTIYISTFPNSTQGKLLASSTSVTTRITSSSDLNQVVEIYELVSKCDMMATDTNMYVADYLQYLPAQSFQNGIDSLLNSGIGSSYVTMDMKPGYSQQFRDLWAIDKKYTISLPAGASHVHVSKYQFDTYLSNFMIQRTAWMGGLTRALMFVLKPTPVHGTFEGQPTTNLTTGEGAIDIVYQSYSVGYTAIGNNTIYYENSALGTVTDAEAYSDTSIQDTDASV